jgi:hypothetical protein
LPLESWASFADGEVTDFAHLGAYLGKDGGMIA